MYNRAVQQPTTAPDFLALADALVDQRDAQHADLEARAQARATIADPVTRDIAAMFSDSERQDVHLGHLAQLRAAAMAYPPGVTPPGASERVLLAFERARAQGNYSSVEALARELDRDRDEEMQAMILAMMD